MIEIKHKETGEVLHTVGSDTLRGADLRGVDLRGADLLRANLYEADLYEADLHGANLHGANLLRANLRGARGIFSAGCTIDHHEFFAVSHHYGIRVKAGCQWWTMAEAREYYETGKGTSHPTPVLAERIAKLDAIEAGAIARGWAV